MQNRNWTKEQRYCIESRGGTLLVSAAAGSGKTSVLVQRIIDMITDGTTDIDKLLVVTFTNAAAAEMKQRLAATLSDCIAQNPDDIRLQRQQMLLASANISTVHGFCASLLREHFHLAGLTPNFRVAEEAEAAQIADRAVNEIIEELYKHNDPTFINLVYLLGTGKNDDALINTVLRIHAFIQSHPFPEKWLEEKLGQYTADMPVGQTLWGRLVLDHAGDIISSAASLMTRAALLASQEPDMDFKYSDTLNREIDMLEDAVQRIRGSTWEDARLIACQIDSFGTLPQLRNYHDEIRKQRVQSLRKNAKNEIRKKLLPLLSNTDRQCREDIKAMSGPVALLFEIVRRFERRFLEIKRSRGIVDFNDMEHIALSVLVNENGQKTPLAAELSAVYDHVMVDEYQDTNAAQDALFRALSRDEKNLFMVGDVKQSIYGFRHTMPEIFLNRRDRYSAFDGKSYPATVTLCDNFRSRYQVTDAVNFVFGQLMTKAVCGINYDKLEELTASASYPPADNCDTELFIIDRDTLEPTDSADAAEARVIASRIKDMIENFPIYENRELRKAKYEDFCILLRSKNAHAKAYADELIRHKIPVWTASSGGFFSATEIAVAVSLLRIIDNPNQDVPLLSVLLSYAFGFSPDDLAEIRLNDTGGRLYTALFRYARNGGDAGLKLRVNEFLRQIDGWRLLAVTMPADKVIHRVYEDTSLTSIALSMRNGAQRVANLRLLHDTAQNFENKGFRGLSSFVRMLDRAERQDKLSAAPAAAAGDAVRIMSIHHSKGLEFPVVFLAGLGRNFNRESQKDNLLLHTDMGVGFKRQDFDTLNQWNTLPRQAVSIAIERSDRAEELRVLYVAMTRAKEKLCMVMSQKSINTKLTSLATVIGDEPKLSPNAILGVSGMGDWILSAALRHRSGGHLRSLADDDCLPVLESETSWHIEVLRSPPPVRVSNRRKVMPPPDSEFVKELEKRIEYRYPYAAVSELPAKLAASDLSHREIRRESVAAARPAFLSKGGLTPSERGIALHTFMQFADYTLAATNAAREIKRLVDRGYLTPQQGESIPVSRINRFFSSPLYDRIKKSKQLMREVHFTIDVPASELTHLPGAEGEIIVVQGIADCALVENNRLVVVDYKTDKVKDKDILIQRYIEQLAIYSRALERTLGLPVGQCILYSFSLDTDIDATEAVRKYNNEI